MTVSSKPWDARLAACLVRPLAASAATPNQFTTLRLVVGLAGAGCFALGDWPNVAALLIVLSNFLDHTDGELARMSGKSSAFGHRYDLAADALVTIGMFVGIGAGLATADHHPLLLGCLAGLAVAGIFQLRDVIENRHGKSATQQPRLGGFEAEDVLYLLPLITLTDSLGGFLHAAAIGAPIALAIVGLQYRHIARRERTESP